MDKGSHLYKVVVFFIIGWMVFGGNFSVFISTYVRFPDTSSVVSVPEALATTANNGNIMKGSYAASPDGKMYFSTLTNPDTYGAQTDTAVTPSSSSNIVWAVTRAGSGRDEKVSAFLKADGRLDVIRGVTGNDAAGDFSGQWTVSGVSSALSCDGTSGSCWRPFDVAVAPLSGRTMVVYGKDATNGGVYYRRWNGTVWSSETLLNLTSVISGKARWVRLIANGDQLTNGRTDQLLLLVMDVNNDLAAAVWTGTAWTSLTTITTSASTLDQQAFDGAWESSTGDALVVYASGTTDTQTPFLWKHYSSSGGTWDSAGTSFGDWGSGTKVIGRWASLAQTPDTTTSTIGVALQGSPAASVASSVQSRVFIWDAASQTMTEGNAVSTGESAIGSNISVAFEKISGDALFVFTNGAGAAGTDTSAYETWTASTRAFSTVTDISGAMGSNANNLTLWASPNSDDIRLLGMDNSQRIYSQRWDGTAWNGAYSSAIGTAVTPGLTSTQAEGHGYSYAWTPYSPWSANWRWYTDENSGTLGTALAAVNTQATVGQGDTVRLRFQASELGGMSATNSRKKLQYSTCSNPDSVSCAWTDIGANGGAEIWRYGSGFGTDDVQVTSTVLSGSNTGGTYVKNGTAASTYTHQAVGASTNSAEWDFTIQNNAATTGTTYYFRMYSVDQSLPIVRNQINLVTTFSYPSVVSQYGVTVGVTSGAKTTLLNSGDTNQYANTTNCSGPSSCAAFTLALSAGTTTLSSIMLTQTGSISSSDISNVALFYDTDGNFSNGVTGQFGVTTTSLTGNTATVSSGSLALIGGTTYYFYVRFNLANSTSTSYPQAGQGIDFQIAANTDISGVNTLATLGAPQTLSSSAGSCTVATSICVRPQVVSYTNSTESALSYSASCTTCGARIGPGAPYRQTVTLSGYGFGTDPGSGSRDTTNYNVAIVGAATTTILADGGGSDTNVTSWSNTAIVLTTDTSVTSNSDTSFSTNYGGASALRVTSAGRETAVYLPFYLFPQLTSLTVCDTTGTHAFPVGDNAREYNSGDAACPNGLTPGEVFINGTRFGSGSTGGYIRFLGCDATTCSSPSGSATTTSWSDTLIRAQVPVAIGDTTYLGNLALQQGTGSNNKTHTYDDPTGFRVLPRLTGVTPSSSPDQTSVTLTGDHFCQSGGVCPSGIDASNYVQFSSYATSTIFGSWSDTSVAVTVPTGTVTGDVFLVSNGYESNSSTLTIVSNDPSAPSGLNQYTDSGLTKVIATGGYASSSPIYLTLTMGIAGNTGGTLYPQIEIQPIGTPFSCSAATACGSAIEGGGVAAASSVDCSQTGNACAVVSTSTDDIYHWQARVRHRKNGVDYYSSWVSFGGNLESATDVNVDTTGPVISSISTTAGTNSATTTWSTAGESSTSRIQYNTTGSFDSSYNCTSATDCTSLDPSLVTSHSVSVSNLSSGTTYYFRVRSIDAAGNETISSSSSAATVTPTQPGKTTMFSIVGATGYLMGNTVTSSDVVVHMPESSPLLKSAFVEITGLTTGSTTNTVSIAMNSQATSTYTLPSNTTPFRLLYPLDDVSVSPSTNTLYVLSTQDTAILSADVVVTYAYTP